MAKNRDKQRNQQTQGTNVNEQNNEQAQQQQTLQEPLKQENEALGSGISEAITLLTPNEANIELSKLPGHIKEKEQQAAASAAIAEQLKPEGKIAAAAAKFEQPVVAQKPVDLLAENPFKTVGAKLAFEELKHYVDAMSVKRVTFTQEQGAILQSSLYRALIGTINAPAEEFKQVMDLTLAVIDQRLDTVFSASSVFRFMAGMPAQTVTHFRMLTNMFVSLAPVKSRALALKQSGMPGVLNHRGITEEGRQRTLAYFGL